MKNFVQKGENLTLTASAAISSGDVVIVGRIHGVAAGDAAEGDLVDVATAGVFELPKGSEAFDAGDAVYFDATNKVVTSTATSNTEIGHVVEAAGTDASTVSVKLVA